MDYLDNTEFGLKIRGQFQKAADIFMSSPIGISESVGFMNHMNILSDWHNNLYYWRDGIYYWNSTLDEGLYVIPPVCF